MLKQTFSVRLWKIWIEQWTLTGNIFEMLADTSLAMPESHYKADESLEGQVGAPACEDGGEC